MEAQKHEIVHMPPAVPAVVSDESNLMNLIAKMASDPAADVPKLERLIALRNEEMARRAKAAYDAAFAEMKPHLPKVLKTHYNTQTKSHYAKLGDINIEIDPILGRFGFGSSMKIIAQSKEDVTVRTTLTHRDGHSDETTITMPLDNKGPSGTVNKTGPHALMSAIEYAKRGGLSALLNVSTGEDKDGQQDVQQQDGIVTTEQAAEIDLKLREAAKTYAKPDQYMANFYRLMNATTALEIAAKDYRKALNTIKPKAAP